MTSSSKSRYAKYDNVEEMKEPDDHLQFDLIGKVGRMNVALNLPFKKVALSHLPTPI